MTPDIAVVDPAVGDASAADVMGIVVVNFASTDLVERNLGSIELDGVPVRVVVVDNWSTSQERERARAACSARGWTVVEQPDNRGFGGGVNAGVRVAREQGCTTVLLLNPDASASVEVILALREHCLRDHLSLVAPVIESSSGRVVSGGSQVQLSTGRIRGLGDQAVVVDGAVRLDGDVPGRLHGPTQGWLSGACLAAHLDLLDLVGEMYEPYFLYWEDVDLSARVEAAGGSLVVRHDLRAVHDEGGTQVIRGRAARPSTYYYWNCRNRLLYAARNLPRRTLLRWILHSPGESWQILLRGGKKQLLLSPRPLWAAVSGTLGGVAVAVRASRARRGDTRTSSLLHREAA